MSRRKPSRFRSVTGRPGLTVALVATLATATAGTVVAAASSLHRTELTSAPHSTIGAAATSSPATHGAHTVRHKRPTHRPTAARTTAATTAAPAPATTMADMPGMTMAPPKPGEWVDVDQAQLKKDQDAFRATKPLAITNNPVRVPEFNAQCDRISHHAKDDPIVFPGQSGASHGHTFFGNTSTDAKSTLTSLLGNAASSCKPAGDHSAYWVPDLIVDGKTVDPVSVTVYYGAGFDNYEKVQPFPQGLRMVVGTASNQVRGGGGTGHEFYCVGDTTNHQLNANGFPVCAKTTDNMLYDLVFPQCWDGQHLDSPDHKQHMAGQIGGGKCDAAHPVLLPELHFVIHYPGHLDVDNAKLASGNAFSMHGDFFDAWDKDALAQRVRTCLNQNAKCNTAGNFG